MPCAVPLAKVWNRTSLISNGESCCMFHPLNVDALMCRALLLDNRYRQTRRCRCGFCLRLLASGAFVVLSLMVFVVRTLLHFAVSLTTYCSTVQGSFDMPVWDYARSLRRGPSEGDQQSVNFVQPVNCDHHALRRNTRMNLPKCALNLLYCIRS